MLPEHLWAHRGSWRRRDEVDRLLWHVFDDRGMYRPGESARVKGWFRLLGGGKRGDVGLPQPLPGAVDWTLRDARGNEVATGEEPVSVLGGFDLEVVLPDAMNLGAASLQLEARGTEVPGTPHRHGLQVQEFRRPEYEVTAAGSEGPYLVGGSADLTVTAAYYAGGGLPGADVTWRVRTAAGHFRPPGWEGFQFGRWTPWWLPIPRRGDGETRTYEGRTDPGGRHRLRLDFASAEPPLPSSVTAEATVTDVNRQAWTASVPLLVHPAEQYVGMRTARAFVERGQPLHVDLVVVDLDGRAVAGRRVSVRAERSEWRRVKGEWKETFEDAQECTPTSGGGGEPVRCTFRTERGGRYRLRASVTDDAGRPNLTELTAWVSGGRSRPRRGVEKERVEIVPEREIYQPGDTARLLVQAPFHPAEGLLTLRRGGLVSTRRFRLDDPTTVLEVGILDSHVPNVRAQVDLVGRQVRTDDAGAPAPELPPRPAFASGTIDLKVPPLRRSLTVRATPHDEALEPGGSTVVDVELRDADGRPVEGAEVAVVVVDEAVLALTGYELADPLETFHPPRPAGVRDHHLRERLLLTGPERLRPDSGAAAGQPPESAARMMAARMMKRGEATLMARPSPAADAALSEGAGGAAPIALRTDFEALAVFVPELPTDGRGRARVDVELPESLTRYRVMAVAVSGGRRFGKGESTITARLPVMARPSPPRFLNHGDVLELPVVVQNQTAEALDVDVAVRAANLELTGLRGLRVRVPGEDRVEVRFSTAAALPGTARVQVGVASGAFSDAAEVALPVWTPATTEAFATYGEIDEGAILQPVRAPEDAIPAFGGLEITTSSTALQGLTDAVLYLSAYRFDCAEQLASRVLAIAALRDVLAAFEAEGLPPAAELEAAVARDLETLRQRQNPDGGFGFWRRGDESRVYTSLHVAHALERARAKRFEPPGRLLERSSRYLREVEGQLPKEWSEDARRAALAYALYVRHRLGEPDADRARKLVKEAGLEELPLEAVGWLLPTLAGDARAGNGSSGGIVDEALRHLRNRVSETAATAQFASSYTDGAHVLLHSRRRTDAILLEALIESAPESTLAPKLARGLLAHRRRGRWLSTQENAWVLVALDRYFREYERVDPDFVARAWLGDALASSHEFRGRSTDRHLVQVPIEALADGDRDLVLGKEGPGRLYYRLGLRYAPRDLTLEPADHGFTVEREYEGVDDEGDVRRDTDGTWRVAAGSRVRVRLRMVAPERRYHVALVDPLPAGLEPLNPDLAVTRGLPPDGGWGPVPAPLPRRGGWGWWGWRPTWHEHDNLRDERAEAFASLLRAGVHSYSYVARATTPGRFVVPPPKAEEMYFPETFGRGATDVVVVE
jgi:uncharacterized protein YfaS (alpha-2-macroglobulin family)